jgi:hypothetical protein
MVPTVRPSSRSRNAGPPPALYLTLRVHLADVAKRLRGLGFHGALRPSWCGAVAYVAIEVDVHSDTFLADERQAHRETREGLIAAGFVVGGGGEPSRDPKPLRVTGYHGAVVYADDPALCPACAGRACLRHDVLFAELRAA